MKNKDYNFIKKFSKISIPKICSQENVDRSNLINGRTTAKNYEKVRNAIEVEIDKLYEEEK